MNADIAATQRIARLAPLADVLALLSRIAPVAAREVPVAQALGHVLATDAIAAKAQPATALAARDGWAVDADATRDAGPYAPMMLPPSTRRIDAFAPMPPGTDAVAPIDAVTVIGGLMQIVAPVGPGEGVMPPGGDAEGGAVLRKAGKPLRAIDIASFAALGLMQVSIRKPRIRIVLARRDDAILQSIGDFFTSAARSAGADVTLADDLDAGLRDTGIDALIGVGGTGSGCNDRAITALSHAGTLACHGIGISPGETAAFGHVEKRPVLLVPGRIDSALACWLTLVQPLIVKLSGCVTNEFVFSAKLSRKITSTIGLAEVVPVRRDGDTITPLASGMLPLQMLLQADGWVLVPADSEGYPAGTIVPVRPLP
ncbi:molybdopterin-binding protein [Pseudorhodoplanes sinuspersici]|uniref:Molybdopterin molybdenumtransferase n=1 Tax=Pseudorhodoplanes sinuspersici TaxID=1235591 RepID=A0A1W6ZN31_9HYPH|nr:molybdopterin-binding protein [Pseudorhodoplanes sinuspersici]ARP98769.1 hypothetical protein CAK95_06540 [Pseudorhodoplanes sinuspersici]RKE69617.1 molybdopterin biosynthesis enzyme [Pseudorhodoplanes sinuspersici]